MAEHNQNWVLVTVRESSKPGEFLVSEPIESDIPSSKNRLQWKEKPPSQLAVLGDVLPLLRQLDVATLKLSHVIAECFDVEAQRFIRDLIGCCTFKMTVFGRDTQQRLHIRLFFKTQHGDSYICLNNVLCEQKYAQFREPSHDLIPVHLKSATFWNALSDSPAQSTREDEIKAHTLGISDYARALEKEKNRKLQESFDSSAFDSATKSLSPSPWSTSESPSDRVRGRGSRMISSYFSPRDSSPGLMALEQSKSPNIVDLLAQQLKSTTPQTDRPFTPTAAVSVGRGYCRSSSTQPFEAGSKNVAGQSSKITHMPGMMYDNSPSSGTLKQKSKNRNLGPVISVSPVALPASTGSDSREIHDHKASYKNTTSPSRLLTFKKMGNLKLTSPTLTDQHSLERDTSTRSSTKVPVPVEIDSDKNITELLQLVLNDRPEPKSVVIEKKSKVTKPQLKGLSKLKNQMEHGRVLVRSPFPQHNLNYLPFDTVIYEALHSLRITKPKLIQSYVWHDILSGSSVAFIAGARSGKTLGYLVPILHNMLEPKAYTDLPKGCSPKAVVVCSTWESAENVHSSCTQIMRKVPDFHTACLTDSSTLALKDSLAQLANGMTLVVATAPALANVMEEGGDLINFDRCCHLIYDDADELIQEHPVAMKRILVLYRKSIERTKSSTDSKILVPRQVIVCGSHWTPGVQKMTTKAMTSPLIFIASCMEAAIYGKMKLVVEHGTRQEMDAHLLQTIQQKRLTKTIIFCRSSAEVLKVNRMLDQMGVKMLLAHEQSIATNFDYMEQIWIESSAVILICTDDILVRLNIQDADTLIHYYIPHQSLYDFSYRLSFCLHKFKCHSEESFSRPESHLLITKEFHNSLLTIVRFMKRFDLEVPDQLAIEAILSYCGKEIKKKDLPLCLTLKSFGFCRKPKLCGLRHIILNELDGPLVPRNGLVDLRISAVHSATHYYARILRHKGNDGITDMTANHLIVEERMKEYFIAGAESVAEGSVQVGNLYATLSLSGQYERVRVERLSDVDYERKTIQAIAIDRGDLLLLNSSNIYELPDHLKQLPPLAVEIFLTGIKPLDNNTTWSRSSTNAIIYELKNKVLSGHIVLALSSTLWVDRLVERTRLEGDKKVFVNLMDVSKKILDQKLGQPSKDHMDKLYHLCRTGSIDLADYTVGLAKPSLKKVSANYAFLPVNSKRVAVEVQALNNPQQFYVTIIDWRDILADLEKDIQTGLARLKLFKANTDIVGEICAAKSIDDVWSRGCIKEAILTEGKLKYKIFFVDYGDYGTAYLEDLRVLSQIYIDRLPFQAIACSLQGLEPADPSGWSKEEINFFISLTRDGDNLLNILQAESKMKEASIDEVTMGPRYCVELFCESFETTSLCDIFMKWRLDGEAVVQSRIHPPPSNKSDEVESDEDSQSIVAETNVEEKSFEVSESWMKLFRESKDGASVNNPTPPAAANTSQEEKNSESEILTPLQIADIIYPTKSASSVFPLSKWSQNSEHVRIVFMVGELLSKSNYDLQLTDNHLTFTTTVGDKRYELDTNLFCGIIPQQSVSTLVRLGVRVMLKKKTGADWPRLSRSPFKLPWLSRDFDGWAHEWEVDSHANDNQSTYANLDPEYAFGDQHSSSSSGSDSSEEWAHDDYDRIN